MVGNPRYGRIGLLGLPYYVAFEALAPAVELGGLFAVLLGLVFGIVDWTFGLLFLLVALGYSIFLSLAALAVEEFTFHRYPRWRDLGVAVVAAVLENIGYRQLHAWWRLRGLIAMIRHRPSHWGTMPRSGFEGRTARP
jgi:hypothetical protein